MKRLLSLALAACMALCLASCGQKMPEPDTIVREDATIIRVSDGAKVSLGMTREEVEKVLGEGTKDEAAIYENRSASFYIYDDELRVEYNYSNNNNGDALAFRFHSGQKYKTFRGAQIGTSHEEMIQLYGNKQFETLDTDDGITINFLCYNYKNNEYVSRGTSISSHNKETILLWFVYDKDSQISTLTIGYNFN